MKKTLSLILALIICLSFCSCADVSPAEETTTALTVFEKIQQADTVRELYQYRRTQYSDENQKIAVLARWKELFLNTFSGYYYNREPITPNLNSQMKNGKTFKLSDDRALYIKSEEEIYFMPVSEADMKAAGLTLEDISDMENSEKYCYRVIEYTDSFSVKFINKYYENTETNNSFKELKIWCNLEKGSFYFTGALAEETVKTPYGFATAADGETTDKDAIRKAEAEKIEMVPAGCNRDYYTDEETALAKKNA
ncbi:MAG: hypothetical protein J6V06_03240, partial [Clostridia bacterium]|nr:hypothetical protein [Clostridia bacterium]